MKKHDLFNQPLAEFRRGHWLPFYRYKAKHLRRFKWEIEGAYSDTNWIAEQLLHWSFDDRKAKAEAYSRIYLEAFLNTENVNQNVAMARQKANRWLLAQISLIT